MEQGEEEPVEGARGTAGDPAMLVVEARYREGEKEYAHQGVYETEVE